MDVEVNKILGEILASGSQATMKAKKLISSVEGLRFKSTEYELKNHVCHEIASIR
jgi:hypothetical protein